jgi:hypothetical protein
MRRAHKIIQSGGSMYKCPGCGKGFEQAYTVHSTSQEPFTAVEPREGLAAYGGYTVAKMLLCNQGGAVHFRFEHSGEERLVRIVPYNQASIEEQKRLNARPPKQCEHAGCDREGMAMYLLPLETVPHEWFCAAHAHEHGYCWSCQIFNAGFEEFDFADSGLCGDCQLDYIANDDEDDYWDDYEDWE